MAVCFAAPAPAAAADDPLVDATWAVFHIGQETVRFLDICRDGAEDFAAVHIPGAVFDDYFSAGWRISGAGHPWHAVADGWPRISGRRAGDWQ